MMNFLLKLSVLMSVFAFALTSCNNEPTFGENKKAENELLQTAKELVQSQNGNIPLPVNGNGGAQSRSALSLITSGTPLWDYVKYYNIDGMQVLMIELQTAEQVFSRITSTKDGVTSTQEVETFSRLVIRKKGTKLYTHVITYMPESEYAMANQEKLDTIGYYPQYVDFTGITLTSNLDGSVFRGIRYENGHVAGIITKPQHTDCDHGTCSHSHHDELTKPININLFTQSSQEPMSRARAQCDHCGEEIDDHGNCGCFFPKTGKYCYSCYTRSIDELGYCWRCGFMENEFCSNCRNTLKDCVCGENICPICGKNIGDSDYANGHECLPNICPSCGYENCVCPDPDPVPKPEPVDTCDICNEYPCICCKVCKTHPCICTCDKCGELLKNCVCCKQCNTSPCVCTCESCGELLKNCICETNDSPIYYDPHDNDRFAGMVDECVEPNTCCAMAVLEMAYLAFGGTEMNQQMFAQYYTQFNYMSPNEDETILDYEDSFMTHFFETSSLVSMTSAINSGNVVVVRKNQHYVLVFGLQYDGDVIYADPHEGGIYAVNESYFSGCDAFEIGGINQSRMRMLAQ